MKKTKMEKGITLIALIITIVVLLILAVVAINAITKDDILGKAEDATKKYNQSVENEQETMGKYDEYLNNHISGGPSTGGEDTMKTVTDVKNKVISTKSNTEVVDAYGNKIVVPAGFKIVVNADTNNADTVTKGIVIEDCTEAETKGSQFVWIPVGKIYTDTAKTEANAKTITLGRYKFNSTTGEPSAYSGSETEDTASSHNPIYGNAIARDIEAFIESTTNGGYYIGRYEARTNNTTERASSSDSLTAVTSIKTNAVYNYVTQPQASSLAQGMYGTNSNYTSDLINSYAWDTAIVFLQTFDNRPEEKKTRPYSKQTSLNTSFSSTGTTEDVICNVYDMASNCYEWSTETTSNGSFVCVHRGGFFAPSNGNCTSDREPGSLITYSVDNNAFRPILYVGL